ncbi:MAG: DUF2264 domain-containing protein [Planctomycetota bacterium]
MTPHEQTEQSWDNPMAPGPEQRGWWLELVERIAEPVLEHAAAGDLTEALPITSDGGRNQFAALESFGRLLAGIAPWLDAELPGSPDEELTLRDRTRDRVLEGLDRGTRPRDKGGWNFDRGGQPMVDAAFLAHGLLRAPRTLIDGLPEPLRRQVCDRLIESRVIEPPLCNWLLFGGLIEIALKRLGETVNQGRVERSIQFFEHAYLGDGWYADGFHHAWDYYNSFVIQPMLVDILEGLEPGDSARERLLETAVRRAQRGAGVIERMVSPEGTFPPIGRSICYRFGMLQLPAMMALRHELPDGVSPAQVRCASTAVIGRFVNAPGLFDDDGWLTVGFIRPQPELPEHYLTVGSMYLCALAFLPLGLPVGDAFWSDASRAWTSRAMWAGEPVPRDKAICS